jgi:hypothetical protein
LNFLAWALIVPCSPFLTLDVWYWCSVFFLIALIKVYQFLWVSLISVLFFCFLLIFRLTLLFPCFCFL